MAPQIRRVLLINPFCVEGQYNPGLIRSGGQLTEDPIGLRYLTSYLREKVEAIDVEIYDAHLEAVEHIKATNVCDMDVLWRMLKDEIVAFQPDLVGVSCLFHFSSPMAHQTCSLVKSVSKKIVTVMGGCYPTVSFLEALKDPNLDYAVFSEGEAALADLITALNNGEHPQSCVDGFAFRDEDDGINKCSQEDIRRSGLSPVVREMQFVGLHREVKALCYEDPRSRGHQDCNHGWLQGLPIQLYVL